MTLCSRVLGDKNPVWFTLGIREVLKGWDKGLQNMCTGEHRKLTVPSSLAYGKEGKGNICISVWGLGRMMLPSVLHYHASVSFYISVFVYLQARSLQAVPSFLTLSLWRSEMVPGHMSLSRRWISMMTGSSPDRRCEILFKMLLSQFLY